MRCFVVAGFLLTSASRGPSAIAEPLVNVIATCIRRAYTPRLTWKQLTSYDRSSLICQYTLVLQLCVKPVTRVLPKTPTQNHVGLTTHNNLGIVVPKITVSESAEWRQDNGFMTATEMFRMVGRASGPAISFQSQLVPFGAQVS